MEKYTSYMETKGRQPANTIQNDVKITIIDLYRSKYYDANFTHFTELLDRHEGISLSVSSVSKIFRIRIHSLT